MNASVFSRWHCRRAPGRGRPRARRRTLLTLAVGLLFSPLLPGFTHAKVGTVIENVELPTLAGDPHPFRGRTNVSAFIFFDPAKAHSRAALKQFAAVRDRLRDRPVSWVAVVSDRVSPAAAREAAQAVKLDAPVLVDVGDALFGRLGVALYPVVGVTDAQGRLRHYLPFHKINYAVLIEGAVRHALGELSDAEFERVLHPQAPPMVRDDRWRERTRLNLARRMFAEGRLEDAAKLVEQCLRQTPDDPHALLLKGRLLASRGKISEARTVYARLLAVMARSGAENAASSSAPPATKSPPPAPKRQWHGHSRLKLAQRLFAAGKLEPALKAVTKCLQREPDYPEALRLKSRVLEALGRSAEARAAREQFRKAAASSGSGAAASDPVPAGAAAPSPSSPPPSDTGDSPPVENDSAHKMQRNDGDGPPNLRPRKSGSRHPNSEKSASPAAAEARRRCFPAVDGPV